MAWGEAPLRPRSGRRARARRPAATLASCEWPRARALSASRRLPPGQSLRSSRKADGRGEGNAMDGRLFSAILLPVVLLGAAIAPAFADVAWDECLSAPKRACVFDEARRAAQKIADGAPRAGALANLATSESKAGLADAAAAVRQLAMQAARSVENDSDREDALAVVAGAAGQAGAPAEAM